MDDNTIQTCILCGCTFTGYGNNPSPLSKGRCCDNCNSVLVVPARLAIMRNDAKTYEHLTRLAKPRDAA